MISKFISRKPIHRELCYFFCIGLFTTCIDFIVYTIGHHFFLYSVAKAISFITGSFFSYLLHKHFTFQQKHHEVKNMLRFACLYITSMGLNVFLNSASIIILTKWTHIPWLTHAEILIFAFLVATACSTVVNFSGQKFWVFKNSATLNPVGFG